MDIAGIIGKAGFEFPTGKSGASQRYLDLQQLWEDAGGDYAPKLSRLMDALNLAGIRFEQRNSSWKGGVPVLAIANESIPAFDKHNFEYIFGSTPWNDHTVRYGTGETRAVDTSGMSDRQKLALEYALVDRKIFYQRGNNDHHLEVSTPHLSSLDYRRHLYNTNLAGSAPWVEANHGAALRLDTRSKNYEPDDIPRLARALEALGIKCDANKVSGSTGRPTIEITDPKSIALVKEYVEARYDVYETAFESPAEAKVPEANSGFLIGVLRKFRLS